MHTPTCVDVGANVVMCKMQRVVKLHENYFICGVDMSQNVPLQHQTCMHHMTCQWCSNCVVVALNTIVRRHEREFGENGGANMENMR